MTPHAPILIAGGGIGGLTAAVALRRAGFAVEVFERAPEIREVGAGIAIQPNAVLALRRIGLDQAVAEVSCVEESLCLWTSAGALLARLDPREITPDAPFLSLHRATLQRALLAALGPGGVHTGCECVGYEARPDGVTLVLRDGRRIEGAVLVGADGVHSAVRERLLGDGEPRYAGYTAWRAVTPEGFAPRPAGSSETWGRGHRFGIVPIEHGRVYWYATSNAPPGGHDQPGGLHESLLRVFGSWHSPVRELIAATPETAILRTDILHRPPSRRWGRGRVTLLGDAAHPLTPNLGQGACLAIEDGVVLADCLRAIPEPAAALRRYETLRRRRTAGIVLRAYHLGWIGQWESAAACRLRDRLVAWTPGIFNELQMRRLFRFTSLTKVLPPPED
jgi:2-polyprenyl-6-methoxyphenol hydroxylase-like FAD-dependent oxidoreductase